MLMFMIKQNRYLESAVFVFVREGGREGGVPGYIVNISDTVQCAV